MGGAPSVVAPGASTLGATLARRSSVRCVRRDLLRTKSVFRHS